MEWDRLAIAVMAASVAGCAASGVKVSDAQLQGLHKGETTVQDVLQMFGPPTTRLHLADGRQVLIYSYAETSVRAATLIPVVGLFAGGADSRASTASLSFDADGKLADFTSSQSQYGTGTGLTAGSVDTSRVAQPIKQ